jgi:hypothetical protein
MKINKNCKKWKLIKKMVMPGMRRFIPIFDSSAEKWKFEWVFVALYLSDGIWMGRSCSGLARY